ncbi:unnamed protein product [Symbiodinium necroappetens]|uniref:Uncharacterized protein n=1 Tax=Symbiodinium necroappetens TaxID=1628268 RepID=A0A812UJJ4_9DINO|nr:unnamed protein product [Symbiodinium necroappetens]
MGALRSLDKAAGVLKTVASTRPVAEVVDCISHIGFGQVHLSEEELWDRLRAAFTCVCIVEWLVPAPDYVAANWHTFKDCETVLTVLEVAAINLPAPPPHGSELIWIFVGPDDWCDSKTARMPWRLDLPSLLRLLLGATHPAGKQFFSHLSHETLLGDLVRLALRLWGLGVSMCLTFPSPAPGVLSPLSEIESLESYVSSEGHFLRNRWPGW